MRENDYKNLGLFLLIAGAVFFVFSFLTPVEKYINTDITQSVEKSSLSVVAVLKRDEDTGVLKDIGSAVSIKYDSNIKTTYMITSLHVVDNEEEYYIEETNGDITPIEVSDKDVNTDLAVISCQKEIPIAAVRDSDSLSLGENIYSVGSPFGLTNSISTGVVSGIHRSVSNQLEVNNGLKYSLVNVIQTDADLNPGNSGGGIFDIKGNLVGITTAIYSDSGRDQGISFAVRTEMVQHVLEDILDLGYVRHPYIGVMVTDLNRGLKEEFSYQEEYGVIITQVYDNSPAQELQTGDIITSINAKKIKDVDDLLLNIFTSKIGEKINIEFIRDGKKQDINIEIMEMPR